jgi:multiple sugar transport system ATP-binding protein
MTVRQNIAFPLESQGMPKAEINKRLDEVVAMLRIEHLLKRKPRALSGGDKQRVALARSLVRKPACFLMDEPLGALDTEFREAMRAEIKRLHLANRATSVYVTHDQVEAMTIGEMLVVLKDGCIHQVGSPSECYTHPADAFVASFLGSPPMNLLEGTYAPPDGTLALADGNRLALSPGLSARLATAGVARVTLGVRPEDMILGASGDAKEPMTLEGKVVAVETLGHDVLAHIDVGGLELIARQKSDRIGSWGDKTAVRLAEDRVHLFSTQDGGRVD